MAEYLAPFHAPKFTDEEFEAQKAKYVAKHGYTVTVPAWDDIILLTKFKPMTEEETQLWKARRYDEIPEDRRADIRHEKARKKAKFIAMLGDPSPKIARNAAAILTSLDDVQDAVSTLACVGMIGAAVIGGPVAAAVLGPLGLILGASQLLNMLNPMSRFSKAMKGPATGRAPKRILEKQTNKNPFSKEAKLKLGGWNPSMPPPEGMTVPKGTVWPADWKQGDPFPKGVRVAKGTKIPIGRLKKFKPSVGNALEALQVTAGIFGVGICLGPIMGFVQGAISGVIRSTMGERVKLATSAPTPTKYEIAAAKALRATALMHGITWYSDASDETTSIFAASWAMSALYSSVEDWNPIDEIEDIGSYLTECPQPTDILTIEILEEAGFDFEKGCVWPQNGQRWISISDLQETTEKQAAANLRHYAEENNHTLEAFSALSAADDFALNFLAAIEGPDQIVIDYLRTERIVINILDAGWAYPEDITPAQVQKFEDWCYVHEYMDTQPKRKDIWNYAEIFCGFTWEKSPEEFLGDG